MDSAIKKKELIKNRLQALYHNCHAAAHFALSDLAIEESTLVCYGKEKEAQAYQAVAGWLNELIRSI